MYIVLLANTKLQQIFEKPLFYWDFLRVGNFSKLRVSHDYPFLIDSPFTELSGENPANVAKNMHSFANQIILMADEISYGGVKNWIAPFVCSKIELLKNKEEGITYIK